MRSESQSGQADLEARFLAIIERYTPALWRLVNSYEATKSRREDLFQEIALGLWRALPRFRGESSERTWLYRIAHNIAFSASESSRRRASREFPMTDPAEPSKDLSGLPDETILLAEKREALQAATHQLAAIDKQIVVLHLEGLSYEEIEQVSGLSQSAIATRLTRIRSRLAEIVNRKEVRK